MDKAIFDIRNELRLSGCVCCVQVVQKSVRSNENHFNDDIRGCKSLPLPLGNKHNQIILLKRQNELNEEIVVRYMDVMIYLARVLV